MQKVIVRISPDGEKTTVAVQGQPGKSCTDITSALEKALGKTESDKKTPEYYQADKTRVQEGA